MSALWFIISVLFLVGLQEKLYEKYIFAGLELKREFDQHGAFPGDIVDYKLSVTNKKLLPLTWLCLEERIPLQLELQEDDLTEPYSEISYLHRLIYSILPYQRVNRRYKIKCLKRGYYELRDASITSTNLLGTKTYTEELERTAAIAVYPSIRELSDSFIPVNTMMGDFSVNRWIMDDPMMIIGVREYQSTDSFKSINWKLTAKNQRLLVNKYDHTADKKIMLFINLDKTEYLMESDEVDLMEEALEIGASIAVKLIESGVPTGVATNGVCVGVDAVGIVEPNTGQEHIAHVLTAFAQMSYMKKLQSRELLKLLIKDFSWGTEIILITLTASEQLMEDLEQLGDIKTTVIVFKESRPDFIPRNVKLYIYSGDGENYEAV